MADRHYSPADREKNRARCGKSMKFGTRVLHTNLKKYRMGAISNFALKQNGGHFFQNGRHFHCFPHILELKRAIDDILMSIYVYWTTQNLEKIIFEYL